MMNVHEECKIRCDDIQRTLAQANAQWKSMEDDLASIEERFLQKRAESWKQWFAIEEADLANFSEGGLRSHVRGRIHNLLFSALLQRMSQQVSFVPPHDFEPAQSSQSTHGNYVLNSMTEFFEQRVEVVVKTAQEADDVLEKKIRKTERDERKQGVVALGMNDTKKVAALKRQRPEIWESAQRILEKLAPSIKNLKEFVRSDLHSDKIRPFSAAVPVIIVRSICDWYFQKSLMGFDQLEIWWAESKASMQSDKELWDALVEKEEMMLRRIENCIDQIGTGRKNYALLANFGGSELEVKNFLSSPAAMAGGGEDIPERLQNDVKVLVHEVSQMHKRLKGMRDCAFWRVLDAAQEIEKERAEKEADAPKPPWPTVSMEDGVGALLKALEIDAETTQPGVMEDVMDAAILVLRRLELLCAVATDLGNYFRVGGGLDSEASEKVCRHFDHLLSTGKELNEFLLGIFDDPSSTAVDAFLRHCGESWSEKRGPQLDDNMVLLPLPADTAVAPAPRKERRQWLTLTRGLQAFFSDLTLQNTVVAPLGAVIPPVAGAESPPASPSAANAAAALRAAKARVDMSRITASVPLSPRRPNMPASSFRPPERAAEVPSPKGSQPNFVKQPWRPDTPSTSCEDAEAAQPIGPKLVDGKVIEPRPNTPTKKLAPLMLSNSMKRLR